MTVGQNDESIEDKVELKSSQAVRTTKQMKLNLPVSLVQVSFFFLSFL